MKIIYEDAEKLIVEKPAGVLTQSARSFDTDLVSEVLTYRRSKKETAYAAVINRLDRPVGGLVLFAKTKQSFMRTVLCADLWKTGAVKGNVCGLSAKRCESESVQSCFKGKQRSKAGRVRI